MSENSLKKFDLLSVDDYVSIVRDVWVDFHGRRTTLDYAMHLFDHASKLGEAIRKDELHTIFSELAELTNWLFGFVAKLNDEKEGWEAVFNIKTELSDMIWGKYPSTCCHCLEREYGETKQMPVKPFEPYRRCNCLTIYPAVEYRKDREEIKQKRREFADNTKKRKPQTLAGMEKMFHEIYEANTSVWTIESIGFHLLEEVGEISRALIDLYTKRHLDNQGSKRIEAMSAGVCDEVAEVFSWMCSITGKLQRLFKPTDEYYKEMVRLPETALTLAKTLSLEWSLWKKYKDPMNEFYRCPYCGHMPCTCYVDNKMEFAWEKAQ